MNKYNGGYIIVGKTDVDIVNKLNDSIKYGKPILWYENNELCYFIDTIEKSGSNIILTKGALKITIDSNGVVTETGSIANRVYLYSLFYNDDIKVKCKFLTTDYLGEVIDDLTNFQTTFGHNIMYYMKDGFDFMVEDLTDKDWYLVGGSNVNHDYPFDNKLRWTHMNLDLGNGTITGVATNLIDFGQASVLEYCKLTRLATY